MSFKVFFFLFLALAPILFIGAERFWLLAILVKSQLGIIPVKSESNWPKGFRRILHLKHIIYVFYF